MKLWKYVFSALAAISFAALTANVYEYLEGLAVEKEAAEIVLDFFSECTAPIDVDCKFFQVPMGIENWQCQLQCKDTIKVSLAKYPSGWMKRQ